MELNRHREPKLLGIPEERIVATSAPRRRFGYHEIFLHPSGDAERRTFRSKELAGDSFYLRDYGRCVVNGDRGLAYGATGLVRESGYLNKVRSPLRPEAGRLLAVPGQAVVCANRPWRNYYHWLLQCLFTVWLLERFDPREDRTYLLPAGSQARTEALGLLGVPAARIGYFPDRGNFEIADAAFSNAIRTSVSPIFQLYRAALLEGAGLRRQAPLGEGRRLYISRRDSPKRKWAGEPELERRLADRGFEIVVASELSFTDQMRTFLECDLLVAPHGAGLTNMLFMPPDAQVVEVKPSFQNNHAFTALARVCGLDYAQIRPHAPEVDGRAWSADAATILRTLDDPALFARYSQP